MGFWLSIGRRSVRSEGVMCVQKWSNVGGERLEWGRSERRRDGSVVGEIRWSFPFDLSAMQLEPIVIIYGRWTA